MSVSTPISVLDPYAPEKSNEAPVKLKLIFLDKTVAEMTDGKRVLTVPPTPIKFMGKLFLFRGVADDGARLYRESEVLDLGREPLSELQKEFIELEKVVGSNVPYVGFGTKISGVDHGIACQRRQEIAFHLTREEIQRIRKR